MSASPGLITILTPCFNERENVRALYEQVRAAMAAYRSEGEGGEGAGSRGQGAGGGGPEAGDRRRETGGRLEWEHLFIDNASTDGTPDELRRLAAEDPRVKVILNQRNFGHVRSPFHGLLQARGDAVIVLAADLQDPPALIPAFIKHWREGFPVVVGEKTNSAEPALFFAARRAYYRLVKNLADVELLENVTGFGLYDRKVIEALRALDEPYPYVRGLISELGYPVARVPYEQPRRLSGITKNNFYTLYDLAMLGITSHSKVPLRLAAMLGFAASLVSFCAGMVYLLYKLIFWQRFALGVAPVVIGLFFLGSVQLFFIGIIGEYLGAIHTRVTRRPLVIEKERIGF
ncbi:MAG: glycosyltransferase family 2 protein [Opitutaceae bacterium]|nr:glycosyltransferase family 2 protein [Opitutaceae bacterium]